ncbi:MAG: dual specificity protein phosphatase family protein [Nitrospiraceae bacterium]|nr:dual specificity protein phosphatase family protein [Nitrospiraceae bacterium]
MKSIFKNKKKIIIFTIFFLLAGYFLYMEEQGNFHQVTPGEAYRSAQLDRDEFKYYIKKYHIKSVVNLRGKNADSPWYKEETEACAEQNVRHFDIPLSATDEPKEEDIRRLIEIFISAPRPLLMHCQAGADRSGLAAAIWKVVVDHEPKSEARKQLSLLYGHIPIGKTTILDRFFDNWAPVDGVKDQPQYNEKAAQGN